MIEYVNTPCDSQAGHSVFAIKDKFYAYSGLNLESQFNDIALFNMTTREWTIPDIFNETPRWNFTAVMVEAISSWRYFIFGGETGDFLDGGPRRFGYTVNSSCVLDIDTMSLMTIRTDEFDKEEGPFMSPVESIHQ